MTLRLLTIMTIALSLAWGPQAAVAQPGRSAPTFETWTVDCGNTGVCFASSFNRNQSVWVDLRIVRDWKADAQPLVRLTTNTELSNGGTLRFSVDGTEIEALPIEQLREMQQAVMPPAGFRPLGGEGVWYPIGPATTALLDALRSGSQLTIELPAPQGSDAAVITVPLTGLKSGLLWLDNRQNRTGTVSAIVAPGTNPATDAPHAIPITTPDQLPPEVTAIWTANRLCSAIDPAIFSNMNAVRVPLEDAGSLYVIPCGTPTAYNTPYISVLAGKDGAARQVHVARMSEQGPIASDLIYNARWVPADKQLVSYFKASGVGECGLWNRWTWNGSAFVLLEEASRTTCDGTEPDLSNWSNTWPVKKASK
ncbi:DUF1176 domain-containing protein [Roseibium denhamense]|uniref:DUF1176 domain-containing protein n=1 Tax=Roseibium denhamense TaxID=76305 RepID=A0ABY1NF50_9HYPH|nr:DUF1176 domain-containing protein [Roseibium denhamense]MTI04276.1 DUF1176 domain-containing protein [Roseibium denhamense]SMP07844.1 Protein of unknown function [Roseibium denhamense]